MSAPPKPLSRAELAAAGRRKLEEFRRQKAAAAAAKQNAAQSGASKDLEGQPFAGQHDAGPNGSAAVSVPVPAAAAAPAAEATEPSQGVGAGPSSTVPAPGLPAPPLLLPASTGTRQSGPACAPLPQPTWSQAPEDQPSPVDREPSLQSWQQPDSTAGRAADPAPMAALLGAQPGFQHSSAPAANLPPPPEAPGTSLPLFAPASASLSAPASGAAAAAPSPPGGGASTLSAEPAQPSKPALASAATAPAAVSTAPKPASAEQQQQQQQSQPPKQPGYQSRLPPPMPSVFDWRSALSRSQAASSAGAAAPPTREAPDTAQPAPPTDPPASAPSSSAPRSPASSSAGAAKSAVWEAPPAPQEAVAPAPASHASTAATAKPPSQSPGLGGAPAHEGSFAAALAAFTADEDEDGGGSGQQQPAWAQRLQGAGARGGLFSSLFGKKGGDGAAPAQQAEQAQQHQQGGSWGLASGYGALSDAYLAGGEAPAPSEPKLSQGYAALADAYSSPQKEEIPAAPTAPGAAGTKPLGGPSSSSSSLGGGYGALSDAYLAPAPQPASKAGAPAAAPPAAMADSSRSNSFASGYATLSDKYISGGLGPMAAPAAGGAAGATLEPPEDLLGEQLGALHGPSVHRPPVTPAPSCASLGAGADGAAGPGRVAGAASAGAGTGMPDGPVARSSAASLADSVTASAAAAGAAGAAAAPQQQQQPAAQPGSSPAGGVWATPVPLPPRVPSSSELSRYTPPQSRGNDFRALQQHIHELTEERFALQRGLEQQSRLAGVLADENEALAQQYNDQAKQVDALQQEVAQLQQTLLEQAVAVERAAAERDAYKLSAQEAQERAQSLAAEVVRLEESVLRLRSHELRVGREAEGATEVVRAMQAQLEALTRERTGMLTQLDGLRNDNADLRMRLRAAEAAATAAAAAPAAPAQPAQLAAPAGAAPPPEQPAAAPAAEAASVPAAEAPAPAPAPGSAEPAGSEEDGPPLVVRDVAGPVARAALAQHLQRTATERAAREAAGSEGSYSDEEEGVEEEDVGVIPSELLALLPARVAAGEGAEGAAADLAAGEGVLALVQSIFLLLSALEVDKQQLLGVLSAKQAEAAALQSANDHLHGRLEAAQQRMELLSQQLGRQGGGHVQHAVANGGSNGPAAKASAPAGAMGNGRAPPVVGGKGGWGAAHAVARRPGLQYLS